MSQSPSQNAGSRWQRWSGGVYVPPARLRAMQAAASQDKNSPEYQRITWDALRKSITGIVNPILQISNKLSLNFFRRFDSRPWTVCAKHDEGPGSEFTFRARVCCSRRHHQLPQVGELILTRLISQFRRAFKRNDKVSSIRFYSLRYLDSMAQIVSLGSYFPCPRNHCSWNSCFVTGTTDGWLNRNRCWFHAWSWCSPCRKLAKSQWDCIRPFWVRAALVTWFSIWSEFSCKFERQVWG